MSERISFSGQVTAEGRRIRGSVQLAGQRTMRNGEWVQVDPAALVKADASGLFASMEHDDAKLLGIVTNNTLSLTRTDQGFDYVTEDLPNTSYANDALELIKGGYISGSSFEIDGLKSTFSTDQDGTRVRTFTTIGRFISVSPVRDPAFPSIAATFSKEPDMPPEDQKDPVEPITEKPKGEDWASFASQLSDEQLEGGMEAIFARASGDPKGNELGQYKAFADELRTRRFNTAEAKARIEKMKFQHDLAMGRVPKAPEATGVFASDDYAQAFTRFLRGEKDAMAQFAQSVAGDGSQGGYTVPDGFLNRVVERMVAFGGVSGIAETITTTDGQDLRWPSNDDTANAAIATEGSAVASGSADLVFGSVTLGSYSYDATGTGNVPLLVSKELIQDAAFDIEAYVARKLGERLGRKMAADFATGSGSGAPKGLFSKSADTMTATTMLAALQEHFFQVDQAYRDGGNCRWVLGDTTLANIFASVDLNGRPLFIPASDASGAGAPAGFLLGKPVTLDQGAGTKVAFGDIRAGYIIRRVRGVQIDVDPYTNIKSRQIAYHGWARADANVQDAYAYSVSEYSGVSADATA